MFPPIIVVDSILCSKHYLPILSVLQFIKQEIQALGIPSEEACEVPNFGLFVISGSFFVDGKEC